MTVRELRQLLFDIENQDAEVRIIIPAMDKHDFDMNPRLESVIMDKDNNIVKLNPL